MDVRKTQNYCAIALSSILSKILDNIIITSQRYVIKTSDLQFGYKSNNCSTTFMFSTLVIEIIQYFTQMHSPLNVLYIDTSKAFDRLCHIELFQILSDRKMRPLISRLLLLNLHGNRQFQIRSNNCLSNMYNMKNGLKHGAVISNITYNVNGGLFYDLKRAATLMIMYYCYLSCMHLNIIHYYSFWFSFNILFNPIKSKLMGFNVKN